MCLIVTTNKDFGICSFLTGFNGEKFIDIGNRDITRIFRLGQHIDKLIRAKTGLKGRKNQDKRHRINQNINKLFIRCKNLINEADKKVRKWLTNEQEGYLYSYF